MTDTIHLRPTAALADRVLLPGDPGRALRLAQSLLSEPKMFNHNRGLWGYTGIALDGEPLTIQSTGMGGPSCAIVIAELDDLGAQTVVRVGTCGALDGSLELGQLLIATEAIAADGTSRALGAGERVAGNPELLRCLNPGPEVIASGTVACSDLFYDGPDGQERLWLTAGALAVEMETATLYALADRRGLRAASLVVVSDVIRPHRIRIDTETLHAAERRMGEAALRGLTRLSGA